MNVDEIHEVIPHTEDVGIWHPQEGVFTGHYKPSEPQKVNRIGQLRQGVVKVIEDERFTPSLTKKYTVADMCTGYGVAEAVKHYYELWPSSAGATDGKPSSAGATEGKPYSKNVVEGKRVVVQGWGNVGAAAGFYLSQQGAKIVGILTREGGLINQRGFSHEEICQLVVDRRGNQLVTEQLLSFETVNQMIWDLEFEVFIPAAASRLVTKEQVDRMIASGVEVFSCGANVPFADPEIFFGATGLYADEKFSILPDFIANCGMARVFAYFMESEVAMDDAAVFGDISKVIRQALEKTKKVNAAKTKIAQASFEIALKELVR
jgi:glutamate dehydrogenase/leucine dehydrogenase